MFYIQTLQAPYVIIRILPNYVGINTPSLDRNNFYGYIEQINYATINFAVGDIVLFTKEENNPSFFNNGIQYYVVSELNIFYIALSTTTKIFDYTFDYTFE